MISVPSILLGILILFQRAGQHPTTVAETTPARAVQAVRAMRVDPGAHRPAHGHVPAMGIESTRFRPVFEFYNGPL
jgi:hypothetical protein